jgi:hypothetical protein
VFYWDSADNQVHLSRTGGAWHAEHLAPGAAAGAAIAYMHDNALHAVSRAGSDGHLVDLTPASVDLTAAFADTSRVFYRTADDDIVEIFDDSGTVRWREVCGSAAADPTAFVTPAGIQLAFRGSDGSVRVAQLQKGEWVCENAA